jgi:hypothetical protein
MTPRLALPLLLLAALAGPPAANAAALMDQGSFKLYQGQHALGAETFEYVTTQDSLVIRARQSLVVPTSHGDERLEKGADILLGRDDLGMRAYQSTLNFRGQKLVRALVFADTHYVAYREGEGLISTGDSYALPAGRMFVMDSQVMTMFDLICRSLHGESFERRPINLLALGPRDTLLEAIVVARGTETIPWGGKPVVAHKFDIIADTRTTFTAWVSPLGQLLRLVEPVSGLRVMRDPPPVKRRASAQPPGRPGG